VGDALYLRALRIFYWWGVVALSPLLMPVTIGPIAPALDDEECGAVDGMRIGWGNPSTRRKPTPLPLCPPIPHDLTWDQTRASAVGSRRLTALAMARPGNLDNLYVPFSLYLGQWTKCIAHSHENGQAYKRGQYIHICVSYRMLTLKHVELL
jgi:hypothetical protein